MTGNRFAALGVMLAFVSGCSLQPVYDRPAAPVAGAFPSGAAYKSAHTGPGGTTLPAGDIGWREVLRDPRLQRLVETALANNLNLRVSMLNVQMVRAQYRIQRATMFPQVSAFAEHVKTHTPQGSSLSGTANTTQYYEVGGNVSWDLDLFGRLRSLSDAALDQYFASAYARQAAEILLVSTVADQYLTLLAFDDLMQVTLETAKTAQASYDIVKLQFDTGTGTELAMRQAESVLELAQANYALQVRGRAQAENALVLLIGQPLPADLPPVVALGSQAILADIPEGLPSDLLTRRPDILQAESVLKAENANIGAARAAFFPDISLTGLLGSASTSLGGLFAAGTSIWSVIPVLTVPIFNGGSLAASLDMAKVQKDIGIAQYQLAIQTAFEEVANGLAARGTYDDQVGATERYVAALQRALDLSMLRYKNGIDPYLTVLTAQTMLYNAQLTLVSTRMQRLMNLVDLYRMLGGGWIRNTGDQPRPPDVPPPPEAMPTLSAARK